MNELETKTTALIAELQALADENSTVEKQTAAKIAELFGTPADTQGALATIKEVVWNLALRVEKLETLRTP